MLRHIALVTESELFCCFSAACSNKTWHIAGALLHCVSLFFCVPLARSRFRQGRQQRHTCWTSPVLCGACLAKCPSLLVIKSNNKIIHHAPSLHSPSAHVYKPAQPPNNNKHAQHLLASIIFSALRQCSWTTTIKKNPCDLDQTSRSSRNVDENLKVPQHR